MTGNVIKILAIVFMVIDHIGAVLFPDIILFRIIGRLAFPLFAFLLVQGFQHTSNIKHYLIRLSVFVVISEFVYDIVFHDHIAILNGSSVFVTLLIGLLLLVFVDMYEQKKIKKLRFVLLVIMLVEAVIILEPDYGIYGLVMIYLLYRYQEESRKLFLSLIILNIANLLLGGALLQSLSLIACYPMSLYNGERGIKLNKLMVYGFYPFHLCLLYVIKLGVM